MTQGRLFFKNSSLLFLGSVSAQAVPLIALPFITRIYDPAAFGLQALAITWATAISVVALLRLDLAAVIPAEDRDAARIVHAALTTVLIVIPAVGLLFVVFGRVVLDLIGHSDAGFWLWLVPVLSLLMALTQLGNSLQIRFGQFGQMTLVNVVNQTVTQGVALVLGLVNPWLGGLVLARVLGQLGAVLTTWPRTIGRFIRTWRPWARGYGSVLAQTRQFVLFNTPYSLVGTVARDAPLLIFAAFAGASTVGLYGLARLVMFVPTSLASVSISPVFFREAASGLDRPGVQLIARRILRLGVLVPTAAFALVAVGGPALFGFIFGDEWRDAGAFAAILAPAFWVTMQSSWIGRVFEVSGRQHVQLVLQLVTDALLIGAVWLSLVLWGDLFLSAAVFAVAVSVQSIAYFFTAAFVAGFRIMPLAAEWLFGAVVFAASVLVLWLVMRLAPSEPFAIAVAAIMVIAGSAGALIITVLGYRRAR